MLPIIFFATDEANGGDYYCQLASGRATKGIVLDCEGINTEHIYTDEDDLEEDIEQMVYEENPDWTELQIEEATKEKLKKYEPYWKECIFITVDCL